MILKYTRAVGALAVLITLIIISGCQVYNLVNPAIRIKKSEPFLIDKNQEGKGWGYYSHPVLFRDPSGAIVVQYNVEGDVAVAVKKRKQSRDYGKTWSDYLLNEPMTNRVVYLMGVNDGSWIQAFEGKIRIGRELATWRKESNSGWAPSRFRVEEAASVKGDLIVSPKTVNDGECVYAVAYLVDSEKKTAATYLLQSTSEGRLWGIDSKIADASNAVWGNLGPCEPSIVQNKLNEWFCVMRTSKGTPQGGLSSSADMLIAHLDKTTGIWRSQRMNYPGVMPKLLQMSNGVLVLAFGRPGNNLVFSVDGGHTWGHEVTITPPDIPTSGYLDVIEVEPGRLLVVYDAFNLPTTKVWLWEPPEPVNAVWGLYVDVSLF